MYVQFSFSVMEKKGLEGYFLSLSTILSFQPKLLAITIFVSLSLMSHSEEILPGLQGNYVVLLK